MTDDNSDCKTHAAKAGKLETSESEQIGRSTKIGQNAMKHSVQFIVIVVSRAVTSILTVLYSDTVHVIMG